MLLAEVNNTDDGDTSRMDMRDVAQALSEAALTPSRSESRLSPEYARAQSEPLDAGRRRSRRSSSRASQLRYEVREEELPQDKFHSSAFQQTYASAKQLMSDLEVVLSSSSLHDEPDTVMKSLFEKTKVLSRFQCPTNRTVGFVGDSGVGTVCCIF